MDPTRAEGNATILVAALLSMYAPDAPVPRMKATTGFFLARLCTQEWRNSDAPTDPPGESMLSSTDLKRGALFSLSRSSEYSWVRPDVPRIPVTSITPMPARRTIGNMLIAVLLSLHCPEVEDHLVNTVWLTTCLT
jgi:hypothetical protein